MLESRAFSLSFPLPILCLLQQRAMDTMFGGCHRDLGRANFDFDTFQVASGVRLHSIGEVVDAKMATELIEMETLLKREGTQSPSNRLLKDLPSRAIRRSNEGLMHYATIKTGRRGALRRRLGTKKRATEIRGRRLATLGADASSAEGEMTADELRTVDFKAVALPMSLRRHYKAAMGQPVATGSKWEAVYTSFAKGWGRFRLGVKERLYALELWRGHLKQVEGQFGSGVLSYFIFLRWLMFLNLFIFLMEFGFVSLPTIVICQGARSAQNTNASATCNYQPLGGRFNGSAQDFLLDFVTGQGWIGNTIMFYGSYPSDVIISQEGTAYQLPLAYLLTGGAYFLFCFLCIIRNLGAGFKESYIESEGAFNSFTSKVFASWDYCIENKNCADHKQQLIAEDIKFELEEEERLRRVNSRSTKQKCQLYAMRVLINFLIVPALWYVSFIIVIQAILEQNFTTQGDNPFEQMLIRFGLSLAVTLPNLILPPVFEFLSFFEDWSPRFELAFNLWRRVFVKLPSLGVLVILLYRNLEEKIEKSGMEAHCEQCWENELAAQMYMLIWVDFAVVLAISLGLETVRKLLFKHWRCFQRVGLTQFDLPRNVLDLAYGQCLVLIGTFFSPLLPIMGVLKLVVFFYAKKFSLFYNNRLPDKSYQGARLSSIFTLLLLFALFTCTSLIGWGITRVPPSVCGPFSNVACKADKTIFSELSQTVSVWPVWLHETVHYLSTAAFLLPALVLFLSLLYYYRSMAHAHSNVISMLKDHLALEGLYKKDLLARLNSLQEDAPPGTGHVSEDDVTLNSLEVSSFLYTGGGNASGF